MATDFDVAVLGGGVAGCAAAIAAAQQGARVCVLSGPPGATAMFSGAWRGPLPSDLARALAATGYEIQSCDDALPHPTGVLVSAAATTASHANAAITRDTLVLGIAGLSGFEAATLARCWGAAAGTTIVLDATPAAGWAPASLAAHIEGDPHGFAAAVRRATKTHTAGHLVLPAVLGITHHGSFHQRLEHACDAKIGEALGTPPSLPGWRLQLALLASLRDARVRIFESKAVSASHEHTRVDTIQLANGDVVRARACVLATGKYAAGGITANGAFREPALDCPVWIDHLGARFDSADSIILTDPVRVEAQPLLRAGVHANAGHQPLHHNGDVVYENVFVAGSIRADWTAESHGTGDAAQDGWNAGMKAVNC